jgi:hypothetical protein
MIFLREAGPRRQLPVASPLAVAKTIARLYEEGRRLATRQGNQPAPTRRQADCLACPISGKGSSTIRNCIQFNNLKEASRAQANLRRCFAAPFHAQGIFS